ncbi:hypothetical protein FXN63_10610 [Pigmentiphaga aceris]|uniref:Uncharacterized protein n=1 Tax=Pigmentiphaga aceris TaxID=1940612 RepID=A0A5C0AV64_9BURK|nr:hypothetical protein [Pigmentiphaga aceris]QEI06238.1 hypothetical protein FXN63_10610 [Pigmentiphaga aceris]
MADEPFTRRMTVTTTRSWNINGLSSSRQGSVEKFESKGNGAGPNDTFSAEIKDGSVLVNGTWYDSMDAVPAADRERIESLRKGMDADGNLKQLLEQVTAMAAAESQSAATSEIGASPARQTMTDPSLAPGAVPQTSVAKRVAQVLLAVLCVAIVWVGLRQFGAV